MVEVIIQDRMGEEKGKFTGNDEESLGIMAQDEGIELPFSCAAGACRTCLCTVVEGADLIDPEAIAPQQIPTEDTEILSCIAAIKEGVTEGKIILKAENL